ncbi:MAG: liaR5 [Frankiales bacterium]|nr:liaR5 [Frankiales bacterium]
MGRSSGLTGREREVLVLVAEGRTNQAIAHALELSPRTVAKHLEHVYRKLDVTCRVQAVAQLVPVQERRR